ncbi:MAG: transporter substrate-binding domain-containing protein [Pseudomonadota bacterium]
MAICSLVRLRFFYVLLLVLFILPIGAHSSDLQQILDSGTLRHLGIPYANFVTGSGDGLDVELMQGFAGHLGVRYQFIETDWQHVFGDLTGRHARRGEDGAKLLDETAVKGDVIANGMTMLAWRKEVVDFSAPTFPSAVWLIALAESNLSPIKPSGSLKGDISLVKNSLDGHSVLALESTCLDPALYRMSETKAEIRLPDKKLKLNEMAPAILNHEAETTLLDVPDALIALEKWPGQLKVIGPISQKQVMGAGFRKDSVELREAFNRYLEQIRQDGTYNKMVKKYYPSVFSYYADFFTG